LSYAQYAFISSYLKGEESKVVTSDHIERMLKTSSIQDALDAIRDTDAGSYFEELTIKNFDDLDEHLWKYFVQRVNYVEAFKFLPRDVLKLSGAYIAKYDVLNIKASLQSISTGKKSRLIPVGTIFDHGLLEELSAIRNLDGIIELLCYCKLGGYIPAVEGYEPTGGMKSKLLTEARLDSEYYKSMLNMARGIKDGAVLSKAIGLLIDLTNLQIASRSVIEGIGTDAVECTIPGGYMITEKDIQDLLSFKLTDMPQRLENPQYKQVAEEILISYGKTSNITAVDETIDRYKFRLLKELLSPRLLSPLVMAWYLVLKEFEMRNLRLILKTIADGIPTEAIKEYLVL